MIRNLSEVGRYCVVGLASDGLEGVRHAKILGQSHDVELLDAVAVVVNQADDPDGVRIAAQVPDIWFLSIDRYQISAG